MKQKTYIHTVIDLLRTQDFYNESEYIDIAKGKYSIPDKVSGMRNVIRRNLNTEYNGN